MTDSELHYILMVTALTLIWGCAVIFLPPKTNKHTNPKQRKEKQMNERHACSDKVMRETKPWRYFRSNMDSAIRRARSGEDTQVYYQVDPFDGEHRMDRGQPLSWYLGHTNEFTEVSEDEAAVVLGGRPWNEALGEPPQKEPMPAASSSLPMQPPPRPNSNRPLWEIVVEEMKQRNEEGIQKYNTPLQVDNGRDFLLDHYAEKLDSIVYMRGWLDQRDRAIEHLQEALKTIQRDRMDEHIKQAIRLLLGQGEEL